MRAWLARNRDLIVDASLYGALLLSIVFTLVAVFMLFSTKPAGSATCASRPGISSGSTWWRFRYRNGVRCWYPGRRYARVSHRAPRRKIIAAKSPAILSVRRFGTDQDSLEFEPEVRTVRIIPMINGLTAHERIERAFDRFMIMPAEDEP